MELLSMKERLMMIEAVCADLKPEERAAYLKGLILEGWYREALQDSPALQPVDRDETFSGGAQNATPSVGETPGQVTGKGEEMPDVEKNNSKESKAAKQKSHACRKVTWDTGKASALWKAGWSEEKIIEELRLDGSKQLSKELFHNYRRRHPEAFPARNQEGGTK
jgi:hypothetical protein